MAEPDKQDEAAVTIMIRVTHIRDENVLDVIEIPAEEVQLHMQEAGNGHNE